jgi:hypothetical protein
LRFIEVSKLKDQWAFDLDLCFFGKRSVNPVLQPYVPR